MAENSSPTLVTADNFVRAESDLYFSGIVARKGIGILDHNRTPAPIDDQTVIRLNRDTLYSAAVFDLDAGPVTITLPDAGNRFMSLQVINEDHYTPLVAYGRGTHTLTRENVGTRYVAAAIRTLVDPSDPQDLAQVTKLQDLIQVEQKAVGKFDVPQWDQASQQKVRSALLALAETLPDTRGMFGVKDEVEPIRHLIGAAMGWGGNPDSEALYLNVTPEQNDGVTNYRLTVAGDVPVDGFWSITVYNADGYFVPNEQNAYSINNLTAKKHADGSMSIHFGGCDGEVPNCLPIVPGWNYMVRLYRPREEVRNGTWKFPAAQPL